MFGKKNRLIKQLKLEIKELEAKKASMLLLSNQLKNLWEKHDQLLDRFMSENLTDFKLSQAKKREEETVPIVNQTNLIGTIGEGQSYEKNKKER